MGVDQLEVAEPSLTVLPTGVRRRFGRSDALLAAVLTGELMTGVVLGMAWQVRDDVGRALLPAGPSAAGPAAGGAETATSAMTTRWVVVPPPPTPPPPPPPPRRTVPRNPFESQIG